MELGVDIAQLNVVNMRNVPPHQLITPNAAAALVVVASQPWSLLLHDRQSA